MTPKALARRALAPILSRIDARIAHGSRVAVDAVNHSTPPPDATALPIPIPAPPTHKIWVPSATDVQSPNSAPFMQYATCSAADFIHPRFEAYCDSINHSVGFHRKLWEFVYLLHHLTESGMLTPGRRGIGFGVGLEPLPAAFANAGCEIVATDAPPEIGVDSGWQETNQFSMSVDDLVNAGLCDPDRFRELVTYRPVDMNHIDDDLTDFDFCWSACCFEHLGSIRHGLDFVIDSVEKCLKPGGIAVHTTEFNLSSNDDTLESPALSLFRRTDLQGLIDDLRSRGHTVSALTIAPDTHYLDQHVDLPPYCGDHHLKLELAGYTCTSVGLVIQKKK